MAKNLHHLAPSGPSGQGTILSAITKSAILQLYMCTSAVKNTSFSTYDNVIPNTQGETSYPFTTVGLDSE